MAAKKKNEDGFEPGQNVTFEELLAHRGRKIAEGRKPAKKADDK